MSLQQTTRQFQPVAIASLFIAIKTNGKTIRLETSEQCEVMEFIIGFCACISHGNFSTQEIEHCELTSTLRNGQQAICGYL
jgi:hypothetical protein